MVTRRRDHPTLVFTVTFAPIYGRQSATEERANGTSALRSVRDADVGAVETVDEIHRRPIAHAKTYEYMPTATNIRS